MEPDIPEFGFKFHMNDVNATIGLANLRHVPRIIDACRTNAAYYDTHLKVRVRVRVRVRTLTLTLTLTTSRAAAASCSCRRPSRAPRPPTGCTLEPVETAAALGSGSTTRPPLPRLWASALSLLLGSGPSPFEATRQPSRCRPKTATLRPHPLTGTRSG